VFKSKRLKINKYNYTKKNGKFVNVPQHFRTYHFRINKPAVDIVKADLKQDLIMDNKGRIFKPFETGNSIYVRKLRKTEEETKKPKKNKHEVDKTEEPAIKVVLTDEEKAELDRIFKSKKIKLPLAQQILNELKDFKSYKTLYRFLIGSESILLTYRPFMSFKTKKIVDKFIIQLNQLTEELEKKFIKQGQLEPEEKRILDKIHEFKNKEDKEKFEKIIDSANIDPFDKKNLKNIIKAKLEKMKDPKISPKEIENVEKKVSELKPGSTVNFDGKKVDIDEIKQKYFIGKFNGKGQRWKFDISYVDVGKKTIGEFLDAEQIKSLRRRATKGQKRTRKPAFEPKTNQIQYIKNPKIKTKDFERKMFTEIIKNPKKEYTVYTIKNTGRNIIFKKGKKTHVKLDPNQTSLIMSKPKNSLISIHSHPYERPPSPTDVFNFLITKSVEKSVVVTKNGNVYIMKKTEKTPTSKFFIGKNFSSFSRITGYNKFVKAIVKNAKRENKPFDEYTVQMDLWKEFAKDFNLELKVIKAK